MALNSKALRKPARRPLPEALPRETETIAPKQDACPDCGCKLHLLGEDVTETLEYIPARFKVIRTIRPKMSCSCCSRVLQEPAPIRPIHRGIAGPGLLAHVLVSKYADHLPLYRQSEIYEREGVDLDRSTLADWAGGCARVLRPLVDALSRYVFSPGKLHADDVPVPVLEPGRGKTKTGRLWTYVRDDRPRVVLLRRQSGSRIHPIARASIRRSIWQSTKAFCRPMAMRASTSSMKRTASWKPHAGRTRGGNSMTCFRRIARRLRKRRWSASLSCMPSRVRFGGDRQLSG